MTVAWMKAWPVDFAGFADADAIIARIEELRPQVMTGSEDRCWASWEIRQLEAMLVGAPAKVRGVISFLDALEQTLGDGTFYADKAKAKELYGGLRGLRANLRDLLDADAEYDAAEAEYFAKDHEPVSQSDTYAAIEARLAEAERLNMAVVQRSRALFNIEQDFLAWSKPDGQ